MIPPQELKKKAFTKGMRGYEPTEVDEYIDFLVDKYTEVFSQCDEYQTQLRRVAAQIKEIQSEEDAVRALAISTQKLCDNMTEEARAASDKLIREAQEKVQAMLSAGEQRENSIIMNAKKIAESALLAVSEKAEGQIRTTQEKSDALLLSARTRCARILNDFKKEIGVQRSGLLQIKEAAENYNNSLFSMYKDHLNSLAANMPEININLAEFTESNLLDAIMQDIKNDAAHIAEKNGDMEYDFQAELDILQQEIDNIGNIEVDTDRAGAYEEVAENADETGRTTVFSKVPEAREDPAEKTYAAQADRTSESESDTVVFDKNMVNNPNPGSNSAVQIDDDEDEEPVATYDSGDFDEDPEDEDDYGNSNDEDDEDYEDDDEDDEDDEDEDDDDEDFESPAKKKLFGGLFSKKKNNKNAKSRNNDDYDDDDDIDYDIDDDDDDYDIDMKDL